ncbi:hypothetical protein [uncultured Clostridium sp.]|uniref:hypothetical protein n=1 Tax=uncultured Clostridium sp. TaxID=59620 RepID=UPI0028EDDE9B|nr:hypothetical protein [uncultured Clostridium sp.]
MKSKKIIALTIAALTTVSTSSLTAAHAATLTAMTETVMASSLGSRDPSAGSDIEYKSVNTNIGIVDSYYAGSVNGKDTTSELPNSSNNFNMTTLAERSSSGGQGTYTYAISAAPGQLVKAKLIPCTSYHKSTSISLNSYVDNSEYDFGGGSYAEGFTVEFIMPSDSGHYFEVSTYGNQQFFYFLTPTGTTEDLSAVSSVAVQQALINYTANNSTSIGNLQNVANGAIDTSKYSVTLTQTGYQAATESADGYISGNCTVTDMGTEKQTTTTFKIPIPKLPQSLNTIATSLSNFCNNYNATNNSSTSDFINAVAITNSEYSVDVINWMKTNATASTNGSLSCTVEIKDNGNVVKTIPVTNKTIAKLADTVALAKSAIKSALSNYSAINSTTSDDLLNVAKSVVNTNFVTVTSGTFSRTPASETSTGNIVYTVNLKDTYNSTDSYTANITINTLDQSLNTVYSLYQNYIKNLDVSNDITDASILSGVLITNSNISAKIDGYEKIDATDTTEGSIKGSLVLSQAGFADMTIPIDKTIARLNQTAATAKANLDNAIKSFGVSNNTTQADYDTLIKNTIDTLKVNYTISNFHTNPATETSKGDITGLITLKDTYGNTEYVNIVNTIDYLSQSVDTVANLYNLKLKNYIPFNTTVPGDLLGLVNISNADITATMLNWYLHPAIDTQKGRITGIIELKNSITKETKTVSVDIPIDYLEQEMATAVKLTQDYIPTVKPSNTMNFTDLLNQVNTIITNPNISASWDYGTTNIPEALATETSTGSVNKVMIITDSSTGVSVNVPVIYTIPKLPYTVAGVQPLVTNLLNSYAASNYTEKDNLLNYLITSIPELAVSNITLDIPDFAKKTSNETSTGYIDGNVTISDGTTSASVPLNKKEIALIPQTIGGISDLINSTLSTLNVSNSTTASSLLTQLKTLITGASGSKIALIIDDSNFSLKPATIDSTGTVNATVEIIDDQTNRLMLPIAININKLPQTTEDAMNKINKILSTFAPLNSTTESSLESVLNTVKTNSAGSIITIDISNFKNDNSLDSKDGTITGTISVSDNNGSVLEEPLSLTIKRTSSQEMSGVVSAINDILNNVIANPGQITSESSLDDLINQIKSQYPDAIIDTSGLVVTLPTKDGDGSIKGNIIVTINGTSTTIPVNITLPQTDQNIIDKYKDELSSYLNGIDPSTITSLEDFNNKLDAFETTHPGVTLDTSKITYNGPTADSNGGISGSIQITYKGLSEGQEVSIVVPKDIQAKMDAIANEINNYILAGNIKSENDYISYLNTLKTKYPNVSFDTSGVTLVDSTTSVGGTANGTLVISEDGHTSSTAINLTFTKITNVSNGGGAGGGTAQDAQPITDTAAAQTVNLSVDNTSTVLKISTATSNDTTKVTNLFGTNAKIVSSYDWEAYDTNKNLVNKGTLNTVNTDNTADASGVLIDANSAISDKSKIQVNINNNSDLNNIYSHVSEIDKYVKVAQEPLHETDKMTFNGANKNEYVVSKTLLDNSKLANNGWNQNNSNKDWYYLQGANCQTGWVNDSTGWYNMASDKKMQTGWIEDNGNWYYLNQNSDGSQGKMQTGWIQDNNTWYYLNSDGSMAKDTYVDGYYLDSDGALTEE